MGAGLGAALVGTFLGILMAYGFVTPLSSLLEQKLAEQTKMRSRQGGLAGYSMLALDYMMLSIVPATLGLILKEAFKAVSGGGEDDEDEFLKKLAAENISYILATNVVTREFTVPVQDMFGVSPGFSYSGPAGLRMLAEAARLGKQVGQGEIDMALFKAANNVAGTVLHYPAGQINKTVEGAVAVMMDDAPLPALVFGAPRN
jgi:hypothetical protein